jgi:hypothetical protein
MGAQGDIESGEAITCNILIQFEQCGGDVEINVECCCFVVLVVMMIDTAKTRNEDEVGRRAELARRVAQSGWATLGH